MGLALMPPVALVQLLATGAFRGRWAASGSGVGRIVALAGCLMLAVPVWLTGHVDEAHVRETGQLALGALALLAVPSPALLPWLERRYARWAAAFAFAAWTASAAGRYLGGAHRVADLWGHPNVMAAVVAASAAATVALHRGDRGLRVGPLLVTYAAALALVALSGSRTGLASLAAGLVVALAVHATAVRPRATWLAWAAVTTLAAALVVAYSPLGDRLSLGAEPVEVVNRLAASEEPASGHWTRRDVLVETMPTEDGAAVARVSSLVDDGLARLHQRAVLRPGETVTFSVEVRGAEPDFGLHVFADGGGRLTVDAAGRAIVSRPPPELVAAGARALDGGWTLLYVTMSNAGGEALVVRPGVAPSLTGRPGAAVLVRRPSLVDGTEVTPYVPTTEADLHRARAALSARQRLRYLPLALTVAAESPWLGHGLGARFDELVDRVSPGALGPSDTPAHPHSLAAHVLVERGVVGLLGLVLLAAGWWSLLPGAARPYAAPLAATLLVSNLGDSTLMVLGPFAAALAAHVLLRAQTVRGAA